MKAIYIYNPHDSSEVALLGRARVELGNYIQDIQVADFQEVKNIFQIAQTPALILISEALQGPNLLTVDGDDKLRVTAELWAAIQQEELVIHQAETHRLDNVINTEVKTKIDENSARIDNLIGDLLSTQTPEQMDGTIAVLEILSSM